MIASTPELQAKITELKEYSKTILSPESVTETIETLKEIIRLRAELEKIRDGIRLHRDQKGDDRCWLDDQRLYQEHLPEGINGADLRLHCPTEMLENCKRYIAHRQNPAVPYVSPQREIERLAEALTNATELLKLWTSTCFCKKDSPRCLFCMTKDFLAAVK